MKICYKRLFQLLVERNIRKGELASRAQISLSSITKMTHDQPVRIDIIIKICETLRVDLADIMELRNDDGSAIDWGKVKSDK